MISASIQDNLMIKLRARKKEGFNLLYENYGAILYGVIFNITTDETVAENLLKKCFVYICTNIDQYKESGTFFTWIICIARSISIENTKPAPTSLPDYKDAMQLIFLGGYTYNELAMTMNISILEVRKNVSTCLRSLKSNL